MPSTFPSGTTDFQALRARRSFHLDADLACRPSQTSCRGCHRLLSGAVNDAPARRNNHLDVRVDGSPNPATVSAHQGRLSPFAPPRRTSPRKQMTTTFKASLESTLQPQIWAQDKNPSLHATGWRTMRRGQRRRQGCAETRDLLLPRTLLMPMRLQAFAALVLVHLQTTFLFEIAHKWKR